MAKEKKVLKALHDPTLSSLLQKANKEGVADKEIVQILKMNEMFVLVYREEAK